MDISGLSKADVLAALYNNARPLGMGFLHYTPEDMTADEAQKLLDEAGERPYFDYLHGRVMKIGLVGDEISTALYNRDNGDEAAERVLSGLLQAAE